MDERNRDTERLRSCAFKSTMPCIHFLSTADNASIAFTDDTISILPSLHYTIKDKVACGPTFAITSGVHCLCNLNNALEVPTK